MRLSSRKALLLTVIFAALTPILAQAKGVRGEAPYSIAQRAPSFEDCLDHFPAKRPILLSLVPGDWKPMALCSDNFAVLYSRASKTPLVVVERLNSAKLQDAKDEPRSDEFYADPRIPAGQRAELVDFKGQLPAVDRGHMAPAADSPTARAMVQSFSLSNMVPQDPTNNRKIWSKIEGDVRKFARRSPGDVYVFTGPLFDPNFTTVGPNKVWKPTRLYKLVYDASSARAWAYVLPNAEAPISRPMSYQDFVRVTDLPLLAGLPIRGSLAEK